MSNGTSQFTEYTYSYSPSATGDWKQLQRDVQSKLFDVVNQIALAPDSFPDQTRDLGFGGPKGELRLYTHPEISLEVTYAIDRTRRTLYFVHFAARIVELKSVFVSYSHVDKEWLERLKTILAPLEQQRLLNIWDDTKIQPGSNWLQEIEKSLESAKMAVFLVTPDFLNSDFIRRNEIPPLLAKAKQQGVQIMWIAVKSCLVEMTPLKDFQAVNDPQNPLDLLDEPHRNKELTEIGRKIAKAAAA